MLESVQLMDVETCHLCGHNTVVECTNPHILVWAIFPRLQPLRERDVVQETIGGLPLLNMMNIHSCLLNQKVDAGLNRLGIYLLIGKDQTNNLSICSLEER